MHEKSCPAKALVPKKVGKAPCIGSMILRWPVTWKDGSWRFSWGRLCWSCLGRKELAQISKKQFSKTYIFHQWNYWQLMMHIDAFCKCCLSEALIRTSSDLLACFSASTLRTPYDDAWLLELPTLRHGVRANRDSARRHIETDDFTSRIPAQQLWHKQIDTNYIIELASPKVWHRPWPLLILTTPTSADVKAWSSQSQLAALPCPVVESSDGGQVLVGFWKCCG